MNKTVELVNHWGAFEEQYPEGSIADFCRHFLRQKAPQTPGGTADQASGSAPAGPTAGEQLLKIIGRVARIAALFTSDVLEGTEVKTVEEANLLLYVDAAGTPKKSEAIYNNLLELSSGTDMMNRLIRRGLLTEYADREDRRSKRMKLTVRGEEAAVECRTRLRKVARVLALDLGPDEISQCFRLMDRIDAEFAPIVLNLKNKPFHKIFEEFAGKARTV